MLQSKLKLWWKIHVFVDQQKMSLKNVEVKLNLVILRRALLIETDRCLTVSSVSERKSFVVKSSKNYWSKQHLCGRVPRNEKFPALYYAEFIVVSPSKVPISLKVKLSTVRRKNRSVTNVKLTTIGTFLEASSKSCPVAIWLGSIATISCCFYQDRKLAK